MHLDRVVTSGAAVSSLLQSVASTPSDFDGLIYGRVQTRTEVTMHDTQEAASAQHTEVFVTSFHCCAGMFSFYSPAGDVDEGALASLSASQPATLLGWFVCRSGTQLAASAREQAVTASLAGIVSRQRQGSRCEAAASSSVPPLFALCSAGQQQGGATCSFQYRFLFQHSQTLQPLRVVVANAGASPSGRQHAYERPSALTQLPGVPTPPPLPPGRRKAEAVARDQPVSPTGGHSWLSTHDRRMSGSSAADGFELVESPTAGGRNPSGGRHGSRSPLGPLTDGGSREAVAVHASAAQSAAVEAIYLSMLARMEALAPAVSRDMTAVVKLSNAVAELESQIQ